MYLVITVIMIIARSKSGVVKLVRDNHEMCRG